MIFYYLVHFFLILNYILNAWFPLNNILRGFLHLLLVSWRIDFGEFLLHLRVFFLEITILTIGRGIDGRLGQFKATFEWIFFLDFLKRKFFFLGFGFIDGNFDLNVIFEISRWTHPLENSRLLIAGNVLFLLIERIVTRTIVCFRKINLHQIEIVWKFDRLKKF